ncbi:TonB-dependent receptor [Acidiphilium acidophilum]|uniref:TonB-dependent receptor n=1 Tax=Acidiphilium acidophilum TaxID=76588 RepID=A0AAW9DTA7_ACIAO|nr:TonB-dependent receptor [Acidiphilium acidophilum]MDX5932426.1 TonB-dependent receptor [Acidiphilium acidophilum]
MMRLEHKDETIGRRFRLGLLGAVSVPVLLGAGMSPAAAQAVNAGTVSATGPAVAPGGFASRVLTRKAIKHQAQSVSAVSKGTIDLLAPIASGTQAISTLPGVVISGYSSNAGTARSTISIRGVKVGFNSVPGDIETDGITNLFDGVPLNSLIQGTGFHSVQIPFGALLAGVNVIYGPGNPQDRWYDSLGGTVNFIPVQPSARAGATVSASYGSFDSQVYSAVAQSGLHDGWEAVIGLNHAFNHTFRQGEYDWPARNDQVYFKITRHFDGGHISLGGYYIHNREFRPNQIPVNPVAGVTLGGLDADAPLYSQKTSGFYSDLPNNVWFKENQVIDYIGYARLTRRISADTTLHDLFWYRHGDIIHYRINAGFIGTSSQDTEYYAPFSDTIGDKLYFDTDLKYNKLSYGAYIINAHTHDVYDGYNTALGTSRQLPASISRDVYNNLYIAGFAQDRIEPVAGLRIVPGVQIVNYDTGYDNLAPQAAIDLPGASFNAYPSVSKDFNRVQPSIGASYDVLPWATLYGNFAVTYQNPTAGNFANNQTNLPALKPVKSTDYEIGVRMDRKGLFGIQDASADINYFRDDLEDETVPIANPNNPTQTTFGFGSGRLQGVNASLRARFDFNWMAFANLGYLDARYLTYTSNSGAVYNNLPDPASPRDTADIGIRYRRFVGSTLIATNVWDQYVGKRYLFSNAIGAPTHIAIVPYNLLNASITVKTPYFNRFVSHLGEVDVSFYATNLLGRKYNATEYISAGGYFNTPNGGYAIANPGAPRAFYGTVTVKF